jgi:hypothetical protein
MLIFCCVGFGPPAVAAKFKLVGATLSTGVAPPTTNVTFTDFGEPLAPGEVIVNVSVYVPAVRLPVATLNPKLDGAVPELPDRVSQLCVLLALQFSDPPPAFEMLTFCAAGLAPPTVAEKVTPVGDTLNDGCAALITNVTLTDAGELVAPGAVTVMVSV